MSWMRWQNSWVMISVFTYYRLTENTLQLAKISNLLMAIECGIAVYKGKCLDEIDLSLEGEYLTFQFEMIFLFYLLVRGSSIHSKGI